MNDASVDSLGALFTDARRSQAQPLWTVMESMVPPKPNPRAVPYVWSYETLRPLLERSGTLVSTRDAERRVFMLVNPALEPPHTSDTLYAGLQLINPGETARAHRHVAFALRFVVEGEGAFTAVGGEKVSMRRGDLVLTPSWHFHDHGHEGTGPMVWLDGLDLPLYQFFPVNFAEPYAEERFPVRSAASGVSHLSFPWAPVAAALAAQPGSYGWFEYRDVKGAPISRVIGAAAERIDATASSRVRRETASVIYHVYSGEGRTIVDREVLQWRRGDTFCIPSWMPYRHEAATDAFLFRYDDRPVLESIGAYRREPQA